MEKPDFLYVPFLHRFKNNHFSGNIYTMWPGLSKKPENYWQPEDYPYSITYADKILNDLKSLNIAELESLKYNSKPTYLYETYKEQEEINSIAAFCNSAKSLDAITLIKENAHKILIWQWYLELSLYEIQELELNCLQKHKNLSDCFKEKDISKDNNNTPSSYDNWLNIELHPFCNWKLLIAAILVFVPNDISLIIEPGIMADILEIPSLAKSKWKKINNELNGNLITITAPLWQFAGAKKPLNSGNAYLDNVYNIERNWVSRI